MFDLRFDEHQQSESLEQRAPIALNLKFKLKQRNKSSFPYFSLLLGLATEFEASNGRMKMLLLVLN